MARQTVTATMRQHHGVHSGQVAVIMALAMTALCAMLALGVDVGLTTARYETLHNAAEAAANAAAHVAYGRQIGLNAAGAIDVWRAMTTTLTRSNLSVQNTSSATAPSDPCSVRYRFGQAALSATYLDRLNNVIVNGAGNPILVGSGALPATAWGVTVRVGGCQPAAFGAVIGHPRYTIWASASAGEPLQGPTFTPGQATSTPATSATPTPTNTPASATATPTSRPSGCSVGWTCGDIDS